MKASQESVQQALDFAAKAHAGQFRNDGITPYLLHPLEVFKKVRQWGVEDVQMLSAALLHDVVEDSSYTIHDIRESFGDRVASYVQELTYDGSISKSEYMKSFHNKSVQALVIKFADRLVNVNDFYQDGSSYAPKYFKKAAELFEAVFQRKDEIEVWADIDEDLRLCNLRLKNIKNPK